MKKFDELYENIINEKAKDEMVVYHGSPGVPMEGMIDSIDKVGKNFEVVLKSGDFYTLTSKQKKEFDKKGIIIYKDENSGHTFLCIADIDIIEKYPDVMDYLEDNGLKPLYSDDYR